jgi:hypothetical protein
MSSPVRTLPACISSSCCSMLACSCLLRDLRPAIPRMPVPVYLRRIPIKAPLNKNEDSGLIKLDNYLGQFELSEKKSNRLKDLLL